ncbi:MAG: 4,5-DOPA dioxygenase extradiol [Rudaea sp.]
MNAAPASALPALFIGHGSPMNAIEDNAFTRSWRTLAAEISRPLAIVCVSAHWTTRGTFVSGAEHPETVHDFGGFPQALFDVRYPARGEPHLARRIAERVKSTQIHIDPAQGLDHGAWSILRIMYPDADIPVLQLSVDPTQPGDYHLRLGAELAPLRDEGVLLIASGNIVHNLRLADFRNPAPSDWALRADALVREKIETGDFDSVANWTELSPEVARAVPTPEHFLPLLYPLGMRRGGEPVRIFNATVQSAISMTSVRIG